MVKNGKGRLFELGRAHKYSQGYTPRVEDYLEVIYVLIKEKGYATTIDISDYMNVRSPTVTKMLQKLHSDSLLEYEKYRGVKLTTKGEELAKSVTNRHQILVNFLKLLGADTETAHREAEGIEHYISPQTLRRLAKFVSLVEERPDWYRVLREY